MQIVKRNIELVLKKYLSSFPIVAIIGPRQVGKTTLAKQIIKEFNNSIYLDLENPDDVNKLGEANLYFETHSDSLICIDEIHHFPDIFKIMRGFVDRKNRNGQFLILGSASPELLKQSSETLAGRIIYLELTPFTINEVYLEKPDSIFEKLFLKGGFPRSFLADDNELSLLWRKNFIKTFLEKDIPNLGVNYPSETIRRLWQMIAHSQGQLINLSQFGSSLGISHTTVKKYIDLLSATFMINILPAYSGNAKKRLVKSSKVYIRDTGILHALLNIESIDQLYGHPVIGVSWETFVIENVLAVSKNINYSFYRTTNGAEIDLIIEKGIDSYAIECKFSSAPKLTPSFFEGIKELGVKHAFVVAPVDEEYLIKENITVIPLQKLIEKIANI